VGLMLAKMGERSHERHHQGAAAYAHEPAEKPAGKSCGQSHARPETRRSSRSHKTPLYDERASFIHPFLYRLLFDRAPTQWERFYRLLCELRTGRFRRLYSTGTGAEAIFDAKSTRPPFPHQIAGVMAEAASLATLPRIRGLSAKKARTAAIPSNTAVM